MAAERAGAPARSEGLQEGSPRSFRLPLTASNPALLEGGRDGRFRQLVYDLFTLAVRMQAVRNALAARIGVTGPQYQILMAIAHLDGEDGVAVRQVADRLHVTGAFVTVEAGKLARRGLLEKRPNPQDGRSVLLRLTGRGESLLEALAAEVRAVNDRFFAALDGDDFASLSRIAAALVRDSEVALAQASARLAEPLRSADPSAAERNDAASPAAAS